MFQLAIAEVAVAGGAGFGHGVEGGVELVAQVGVGISGVGAEELFSGFGLGFGFFEEGEEVCAVLGGGGEALGFAVTFPEDECFVGGVEVWFVLRRLVLGGADGF